MLEYADYITLCFQLMVFTSFLISFCDLVSCIFFSSSYESWNAPFQNGSFTLICLVITISSICFLLDHMDEHRKSLSFSYHIWWKSLFFYFLSVSLVDFYDHERAPASASKYKEVAKQLLFFSLLKLDIFGPKFLQQ